MNDIDNKNYYDAVNIQLDFAKGSVQSTEFWSSPVMLITSMLVHRQSACWFHRQQEDTSVCQDSFARLTLLHPSS